MRLSLVLLLLLSPIIWAEDRFYSTVDAQGRVQIIKESADGNTAPSAPSKPDTVPDVSAKVPAKTTEQTQSSAKPTAKNGLRQLEQESYIDSEVLEQKNFNPDDKKRFYYVPDGAMGSKVIESEDGLSRSVAPEVFAAVSRKAIVSPQYQYIDAASWGVMYQRQSACLDVGYLHKHAKPLTDKSNIWVRQNFEQANEPEAVLALSQLDSSSQQLRLESFATTYKRPSYYLPVVAFVDSKGCVLSGAWHYWSSAYPASDKLFASLDGLLTVPAGSAYVLFYRPINTLQASVPMNRQSGSLIVEVYTKRSP